MLGLIRAALGLFNQLAAMFSYSQAKRAGANEVENAQLTKTNSDLATATKVDAQGNALSDADVAAGLREFQRDK